MIEDESMIISTISTQDTERKLFVPERPRICLLHHELKSSTDANDVDYMLDLCYQLFFKVVDKHLSIVKKQSQISNSG